jgi:parallel beta-helix repeat protein
MRRAALLLALGTLAPAAAPREARAGEPKEIVLDRDDIDVTESVVVRPGVYRVADKNGDGVLRLKSPYARRHGLTLRLDGVTLDGSAQGQEADAFDGVAVSVEGARSLTITGGTVRGFRVGLRAVQSGLLTVTGLDASGNRRQRLRSTPEREDSSDWLWPHENDGGQWERSYGAGISLTGCADARVEGCRVRAGQNGLLLTRCDRARVRRNDFSFNSGWGIALYRSNECVVESNRCDWCVRGYSHGVYARGQDSAGILVFEQCSNNHFALNSATHSGDGFFLYAGNETLKRTGAGGCNGNKVVHNDFSHAVANAVEATFSERNEFFSNRLDDSDHGVWAGYSRATVVHGNRIHGCAHGVSIEHGVDNRVEGNSIVGPGLGVHLWWDPDPDLVGSVYGQKQATSSARNRIVGNEIEAKVGVRLDSDTASEVRANRIVGAEKALDLVGTTSVVVAENALFGKSPDGSRGPPLFSFADGASASFSRNFWTGTPVLRGAPPDLRLPEPTEVRPPSVGWSVATKDPPDTVFLPKDAQRGRRYILVDEWGPIDPTKPTVFPKTQSAVGAAAIHVLGAGVPWKVTDLTGGFVADPSEGTAPATLRVRPGPGAAAYEPFEAKIRVGEADFVATGTVLSSRWKVRWWPWTKDPREDAAAFSALVATAPKASVETDALDYAWGGGAPHPGVPADRFVTVATTTLTLPAGRWRLRTVSDDGIRVKVDGKTVLEDWTWHAPKEDSAEVDLAAGPHEVTVEHFELDGWSALRLAIEPANAPGAPR